MSKPRFRSLRCVVGGLDYYAICRVIPAQPAPHVGADSPSYLRPARPAQASIIRILRGGEDVTSGENGVSHWTRTEIQAQADEQVRGRKSTVRALPAEEEPA